MRARPIVIGILLSAPLWWLLAVLIEAVRRRAIWP